MVRATTGTVLDLLADDLVGWMDHAPDGMPRRVLLWLDPEGQFARLVTHVEIVLQERGVHLFRYSTEKGRGQFAIKLALLRLEGQPEGRAVVYLPGFPRNALEPVPDGGVPGLWALYDYRYKGTVWGLGDKWEPGAVLEPPTLLGWLRRHGVRFADDRAARRLTAGAGESPLARYVERLHDQSPKTWPKPLRESDVHEALGGDPRDALRRLLAAPNNEVKRWGDNRHAVLERIAAEYGLVQPEGEVTPEALADSFTAEIALIEAWDAFGQPPDFPFASRLPKEPQHRQGVVAFLRDEVMKRTDLGPGFLRRMERLEAQYNLERWASDRSGHPVGLPRLARTRWRHFLERFDRAAETGWREAVSMLQAERGAIEDAASGVGNLMGTGAQWQVLLDLETLATQAQKATSEAELAKACAQLVDVYSREWWQIDRLHLRVRGACASEAGLERVRRVADLAYADYVARANQQFTDLVELEAHWPPQETAGVETLREALWRTGKGQRAVIIVDALRWDLAQGLRQKLGEKCEVRPVVATLPSQTSFGMAALLPLDGRQVTVDFGAGGLSIRDQELGNVAEREGRKRFLEAVLAPGSKRSPQVQFLDLEELLQGAPVSKTPLVVVFDNTIDEQGHKGTEELPGLAEQLLGKLYRAIERLRDAGVSAVDVVTDHGFLLLPGDSVDALGRPEVPLSQTLAREERWAALKPDAPTTDVFRLALPLSLTHTLGFPRGVRTLTKAGDYLHGGISLQECVVPHLQLSVAAPSARLAVEVRVSTTRLSGGTVPVILRPVLPEKTQTPLGGLPPLKVRLWVEAELSSGAPTVQVTEPLDVLIRSDAEELRPGVYLKEGLRLAAGQGLVLKVLDSETGEELARSKLTLLVDWE